MGQGNKSWFAASGPHDHDGRQIFIIMVKTLLKASSSEPRSQWPWGLLCSIRDIGPIKFEKIRTFGQP